MKLFRFLLLFFPFALHAQQTPTPPTVLKDGDWLGDFTIPRSDSANDNEHLPVRMRIAQQSGKMTILFYNAEETISVEPENVTETADSLFWRMPVFDSEFQCRKITGDRINGIWINHNRSTKNIVAFAATRRSAKASAQAIILPADIRDTLNHPHFYEGRWKVRFSAGTPDSSMAIGLFRAGKTGNQLYGTFLTETGDYRYLEGEFSEAAKGFWLTCFDGSHLFGFIAKQKGDTLYGHFYSGIHWHERWTAVKDANFKLRDPKKLTWVKDSSNVNFTFTGLDGKPVSLSDARFKNKVVIVQVMGSWCPNCMDETKWLSSIYPKYQKKGLEIIALAYEKMSDTAHANANIRRMKTKFNASYTFLNTQKTGKDEASASLPFLNGIMSFPTTIYIDRKGKVRRVFTGFNGPATGAQYEQDNAETLRFIQQLLSEK